MILLVAVLLIVGAIAGLVWWCSTLWCDMQRFFVASAGFGTIPVGVLVLVLATISVIVLSFYVWTRR